MIGPIQFLILILLVAAVVIAIAVAANYNSKNKKNYMYCFLDSNGQQQGPVAANDLPRYGVTPQTLVWRQGMSGWQVAGNIAELSAVFAPPQPRNAQQQ